MSTYSQHLLLMVQIVEHLGYWGKILVQRSRLLLELVNSVVLVVWRLKLGQTSYGSQVIVLRKK